MGSDFLLLLLLVLVFALLIVGIVVISRSHRRPSRESAKRTVFWGVGLVLTAVLIGLAGVWLPADGQLSGKISASIGTVVMLPSILILARRQLARANAEE
ncbi:hypothetical protein C5B92_10870 [Rathayibacter sp. AY1A4]|uniref:hypothetical protein n=1 Tax=Rathayibacter sp. AY1A4 TaxID=2080522 RepID=UPI000CE83664|nr:hypothetical protein [Rathayibacter sp. AY1A4]PPF16847.1 hypothetical protein C5B92_10870 [Rathayibacter sp. AY1A4]